MPGRKINSTMAAAANVKQVKNVRNKSLQMYGSPGNMVKPRSKK